MEMFFLAIIFSILFWIPGVIFAYWTCFIAESIKNQTAENESDVKSSTASLILHNPTPIHPKANQIISFPITTTTVTIHFPEDKNPNDLIDNISSNNTKSCMV